MHGLSEAPEMIGAIDPAELADAGSTNALKVVLHGSERKASTNGHVAAALAAGAA